MACLIGVNAGPCPIPRAELRPMKAEDVAVVDALERTLYPFPWTPGNFRDSLAAGYDARVLMVQSQLVAYSVAMSIPDELHLLNLSVSAGYQRLGLGRWMLAGLFDAARTLGLAAMLLEVRPSNEAGQGLYRSMGFEPIGLRRRYYPSFNNTREDAIVMRCRIDA